jgi:hypothetical protein
MFEPEHYWRSKIECAQRQVLETIYGAGIAGPDFNVTVQIGVRGTEEVSASDRSQRPWRLRQRVDLVFHKRIEIGLLYLKSHNLRP